MVLCTARLHSLTYPSGKGSGAAQPEHMEILVDDEL